VRGRGGEWRGQSIKRRETLVLLKLKQEKGILYLSVSCKKSSKIRGIPIL
jgi:hypothetical protein